MKQKVTAVFDIGKTNKKFFLFDEAYQQVHKEYIKFDEISDEDGYPTEDLASLQKWLKQVFNRILATEAYEIKAINFSTYGASFVHLDENGNPLTPLYNYTKQIDQHIIDGFLEKYGPREEFLNTTGCADLSLLNSGLQLYWIKHGKPEIYKNIKYSLHLPQYLSYVFIGIPLSEYTSIGCHTGLWNYEIKDYYDWVYEEGIHKILPPIVSTETSVNMNYNGKRIKIGVGIHDSSAALLSYVRSVKKKFVLVSTGTWSIAFNPFDDDAISKDLEDKEAINYMRINGKPVKATRLFLGNEYKIQVQKLDKHFDVSEDYHRSIKFDYDTYFEIIKDFQHYFKWESITDPDMPSETKIPFDEFEHAYHQLMTELVLLQIKSIKKVIGDDEIKRLYVDGGFSDNEVYIKLLSHYFRDKKLRTTDSSLGSALGAAIAISDSKLNSKFLKNNYSLKKHVPFIVK
ncbi:carbohydrate kinase [Subsaximicrobium wynnwilliamsii]|uniref:Carbohydrate kinase n=1 Tax=Subsaximicrobium wynnwilliamsii TaxID=291179 RepID=A0A5C6ZCT7_9FLAO|nr:FGGY family carbohydrate kinase [Subsaximicrobium wynnwilliamsii]TXD82005.1 carbohydrate kinase [Subsaximicrobium wynnwilliamsii]TXD86883.1 carbohydrate kinase [Subsaximicrobium wynnwilliamsii]TXE01465.1 carbohydrate kinase [Subsaximicrobium wynnwilliamsii]